MGLKRDRVVKFLKEQCALRPCNSCGANADNSSHSTGEFRYSGSYGSADKMVEMTIIECDNCANIQLFANTSIRERTENGH